MTATARMGCSVVGDLKVHGRQGKLTHQDITGRKLDVLVMVGILFDISLRTSIKQACGIHGRVRVALGTPVRLVTAWEACRVLRLVVWRGRWGRGALGTPTRRVLHGHPQE